MTTTSQVVKRMIDSRPMLQESLIEGIINFSILAKKIQPKIEAELDESVKTSAVIMALRRHADKLQKKTIINKPFKFNPEIIMKTNLCDVCVMKTHTALINIEQIHKIVDYEKGDTLNIIQGNHEITIVISQKHLTQLEQILKKEKILNIEKSLVSLTLSLTKEFLYTPGILSLVTRKLAWENINIFENISTMTELIFITAEKDAVKAYNAFKELLSNYSTDEIIS
jgi:aspartokinase